MQSYKSTGIDHTTGGDHLHMRLRVARRARVVWSTPGVAWCGVHRHRPACHVDGGCPNHRGEAGVSQVLKVLADNRDNNPTFSRVFPC
jgi:hypothetical protein